MPCCVCSPAKRCNPQAVFCAQNLLHFALLISVLAKTLRLTLWGESVVRVWSLRDPATSRPFQTRLLDGVTPTHGPWGVKLLSAVGSGRNGGLSRSCNTRGGFSVLVWGDARASCGWSMATRGVRAASPRCSEGGLLQRLAWQRAGPKGL